MTTYKTKNSFDERQSVYTPPEVSTYGINAIKNIRKHARRALPLGIAGIDGYFAPLLPGEVACVIAQTSHYKSGFLHSVERNAARILQREGRENEVLIHVSVEEPIEKQAYYLLGREAGEDAGALARGNVQDWQRLNQAAIKIGQIPIYRIGESIARAEDFPYLSITNMVKSIKSLSDGKITGKKLKIGGLFFDYLQAFPFDNEVKRAKFETQRRLQVREDIYRLRQAAAYFDCPVWVAVQAKQKLTGNPHPNILIPGIYDGEESSSIGQRADRIIQLWMPKMTHSIGDNIFIGDNQILVEENLLFLKVGKQRGGLPSGKFWQCRINFSTNVIALEFNGEQP